MTAPNRRDILRRLGAATILAPVAAIAGYRPGLAATNASACSGLRGCVLPGTAPSSLLPIKDIPVFEIDVEASRAAQDFVAKNNTRLHYGEGFVLKIPAGAEIPIKSRDWRIGKKHNPRPGARVIIVGGSTTNRPLLFAPRGGLFFNGNLTDAPISFELENLVLKCTGGEAIRSFGLEYIRLTNVDIDGGRNGLFVAMSPTTIDIDNCTISHGGTGDGTTHGVYINYVKQVNVYNSKFYSPKAQAHAFKCYAQTMNIINSLFATWLTEADLNQGFYGELPPLDLGAWSTTRLVNNTIIRRGPVRDFAIEYRNRQYPPGRKYSPQEWGTRVVDHHLVDNRDESNPYLFRHLLYKNSFINGVMPNGQPDPFVRDHPGYAVRNNGAAFWGTSRSVVKDPPDETKPDDWKNYNERAVIWAVQNRFEGVPFVKRFVEVPYNFPGDFAPVRVQDDLPAWAKL